MNKFNVDLRDFFRTGEFGPIRLGMTKQEVELLLGKPLDWGGTFPWWRQDKLEQANKLALSHTEYPIWRYDEMEFHFGDVGQKLFLIYCDYLERLKKSGKIFHLERWIFKNSKSLTSQELEQGLLKEGIPFERKQDKAFGELVLASGVTISYEYDDDIVSSISHDNDDYIGVPQLS